MLKQKLQHSAGVETLIEALKGQREELLEQLKEAKNQAAATQRLIDDLRGQLQARNKHIESQDKTHADELAFVNKKLNSQDERNRALGGDVNQHLKTISEHKSKISALEQYLCNKEDLNRQLDQMKQRVPF